MITHFFQMINMASDEYRYAYCLMTCSKPKKYEVPIILWSSHNTVKFISPTKSQSRLLSTTTVCYIWQVLLTIFTNKISIKHLIQEIRIYSQRQPLMLAFKAKYLYWRKQYLWQYEHYSPKPRYNNSPRAWTWIWFIPINQNRKGKKIYHSKHILHKKCSYK